MRTSAAKLTTEEQMRTAARICLEDRAYDILVRHEGPAKTGEILRQIGIEDVTLRAIRHLLATSPRFESVDRRWTLADRTQDTQRPFERIVESAITAYGRPISLDVLANELALTLDRPRDYYVEMVPRMLAAHDKFFVADTEYYGLSSWLVVAESDKAEDVLFDNFIEKSDLDPYKKVAAKAEWDADNIADSANSFIDAAGMPVPMKVLAFHAWSALGSDYDAVEFYSAVKLSDKIDILSNQYSVSDKMRKSIIGGVQQFASEIEDLPPDVEEEAAEAAPVTVSEADRDEIVALIEKQGGMVTAEDILESVLEMSPGERGWDAAVESLVQALTGEERVVSVGTDRWRLAGTIPEYVLEVPSVLEIPATPPFETPEGDMFDQELEDDGIDAGLREEMLNPLVEDIGDEDPEETSYQPMDTYQRAALKYHHKEAGTMPLIQFHPDFFGREPEIVQIVLIQDGVRRDAWINNSTRLMYGLKDWYTVEMPVSGAAFEIHRTERPGEYRFMYDNRTDAMVFVPTSRLIELLELKNEVETHEMPVFDVIVRILEHYKKGIAFVPLFIEVNLVRRVSRRLVASILSSYHCFHVRGKTGEWQYDVKKRTQGFNKTKRKYIRK